MRLLDFLFPPRADELALRDLSADDFLVRIAPRLAPDTRPSTVTLLPFSETKVRSALHEAKYCGNERALTFLGSALAEYLRDFDDENYGFTKSIILVPVPLGKKRRKERGFNQVEEVIRHALKGLKKEDRTFTLESGLLIRTRETTSQVSLTRMLREKNMRGAFACPSKLEERSRATFIVIDDVITTGATLQAAIDALSSAGASRIIPLALAH